MEEEKRLNEDELTKKEIEKEERTKWWVTLIIFVAEFAAATGLFFATLLIRNFFEQKFPKETTYRYLADAFTIPGVVFILIGVLVILVSQGAFNGIGYAMRHLGRMLFPFFIRKDITYYEYLQNRKAARKTVSYLSFLIVGSVFLIGAVIFIILFYQAS